MFIKRRLNIDYYISSYAWWRLDDNTLLRYSPSFDVLCRRDEALIILETGGFND